MLLYHMNLGFPLLEEGAELLLRAKTTEAMSAHTLTDSDWRIMCPPIDNNEEYLYVHTPQVDADGMARAALWNERLSLGLEVSFTPQTLPYLVQWKCMKSGDYALGVLPSTCKPVGRLAAAETDQLTTLGSFETMELELELRVVETKNQLLGSYE